jgi:hypothetical protein
MKIRIVQTGYETFTGLLGDVKFENGLSASDVSEQQAAYIGAMFVIAKDDEPVDGPIASNKTVVDPADVPLMPEGQTTDLNPEGQKAEGTV